MAASRAGTMMASFAPVLATQRRDKPHTSSHVTFSLYTVCRKPCKLSWEWTIARCCSFCRRSKADISSPSTVATSSESSALRCCVIMRTSVMPFLAPSGVLFALSFLWWSFSRAATLASSSFSYSCNFKRRKPAHIMELLTRATSLSIESCSRSGENSTALFLLWASFELFSVRFACVSGMPSTMSIKNAGSARARRDLVLMLRKLAAVGLRAIG
mmetsp:Transcript_34732/g.98872  ORF Transcript_34732/g.98872 Transcript_34732/m.98872 type:complete len:215 (+) Transcript_34732:131-775(+)